MNHETVNIEFMLADRVLLADNVENPEVLLKNSFGQPTTAQRNCCTLQPGGAFVLDFGRELFGGIELITSGFDRKNGVERKLLVTFGESLSESCTHPDYGHALQEWTLRLAPWALLNCGELGFRFVRVENCSTVSVDISEARARAQKSNATRLASFECSDARINGIWEMAANTLELCTRRFFWDGIKRDKLIWMGDLYPEVRTAEVLFGNIPQIGSSLDFMRDETPLPRMMNDCFTYSLWWILGQELHFRHTGDMEYLAKQREYLTSLLHYLAGMVQPDGQFIHKDGFLLLDWVSGVDCSAAAAIHDGNHALMAIALRKGAQMCQKLGETACAAEALTAHDLLKRAGIKPGKCVAANALMVLAGMQEPCKVYEDWFAQTLPHGMSTFLGPLLLDACVMAGHKREAIEIMKQYYGGMLDLGSTTFWEHFDVDWLKDAARIDELPKPGQHDVHKECGTGCFASYRNSLCHGWGAGIAEWLIRNILGISFLDASTIAFNPDLCGLTFARGTVPSIHGMIEVELSPDKQEIRTPKGITMHA